jgi:uncharacterized protein (DUF885 family)
MRSANRAAFALGMCLAIFAATPLAAAQQATASGQFTILIDEVYRALIERDLALQQLEGIWPRKVPDISLAGKERERDENAQFLQRLRAIPVAALGANDQLTQRVLDWYLVSQIEESRFYWLVSVLTPYKSYEYGPIADIAGNYPLRSPAERAGYLEFLGSYAQQLKQRLVRTQGQASRGIRIPQPALPGVIQTYESLASQGLENLRVAPARLAALGTEEAADYRRTVDELIERQLRPAARAIGAYVGAAGYRSAAPRSVGLSQYPQGRDYYLHLVRFHTTLDVKPEELHAFGLQRMAELQAEMAEVRKSVGFNGTHEQFVAKLRNDQQLMAGTPEKLGARYLQYVAAIRPLLPQYFARLPKAAFDVRRLDPAAEATMTFGYYDAPTSSNPIGVYRYNAGRIADKNLLEVGPLIYHELMPGHHMQVSLSLENEALPPIRRRAFYFTAYSEGWADYAASLATEMGLLSTPYERYGALTNEAFTVARLVLDTGMNYYGWSLQRARDYFRRVAFVTEADVATETLRYSTDIPGQALGYRIGERWFHETRSRVARALGPAFDIREFHSLMLDDGEMPLGVLEHQVDVFLARRLPKK